MDTKEKSLKQLFIPIYLELLFLMLVGSVDTLMLSGVGDDAVGAVGAANTYLGVFTITFSIISSGMLAVMTQYIGAKKIGVAKQARTIGLIFNGIVGLAISVLLLFNLYAACWRNCNSGGCYSDFLLLFESFRIYQGTVNSNDDI